jgi:hypothetical protein
MQKYVKVRSTAPEVLPLEIDEYHVTLNNGITEIHEAPSEEGMDGGFDGWEISEQIIYDKDEYIKVITEKSSSLDEQVTAAQMALVELYEMMI